MEDAVKLSLDRVGYYHFGPLITQTCYTADVDIFFQLFFNLLCPNP